MQMRWQVGSGPDLRRRLRWRLGEAADGGHHGIACTRLPDGTAIAVTGSLEDGWVRVWDLATGAPRGGPLARSPQPSYLDAPAVACARLADGTPVTVTGFEDGTIQVWDLVTGRLRGEASTDRRGRFTALACTQLPDGTAIAVTGRLDGAVQCWDLAALRPYGQPLPGAGHWPLAACTRMPDGTPVAVIGEDGALRVWDLVTGDHRGEPILVGFGAAALACAELADGTPLAIVGSDRQSRADRAYRYGTVQAWDLATGRRYGPALTGHAGEIEALAGTQLPDGTVVAVSVDRYGSVQVWDLATGHRHGPRLPHGGEPPEVVCTRLPDGTPVTVVMTDEDLWVWDLTVEPTPEGLAGNLGLVGHTRSPDGDALVVTAGGEHRREPGVQVWDAATGRLRGRPPSGRAERVQACTRLRDGSPVVVTAGHRGGGVQLWDPVAGTATDLVLAGHPGEVDILDCVVLRDGTSIIITGDGPVRAWDAATGHPYGTALPVDAGWRRALSALELPDGTLLVVHTDSQGRLQAWDMRTGRPHGPRLAGPGEPERDRADVVASMLLPDGTPVAVTTSHGHWQGDRIRVWDLAQGRALGPGLPVPWRWPWALAGTRLPDGRPAVAAGGGDARSGGTVQVWDLASGDTIDTVELPEPVTGLAFTAPDRLVVATELDIAGYDLS